MNEYDVVVAGAGPGGATVAASLAASGYQVALLERGRHPVPHLPETWFPRDAALLDALGVDGIEKAFLDQAEVHFYNASGDFGLRLRLECVSHEGDRPVRLNRSIFDEILGMFKTHGQTKHIARRVGHLPLTRCAMLDQTLDATKTGGINK